MISTLRTLKSVFWSSMLKPSLRFGFSGIPTSFLRPSDSNNTEIVSLSIEQTEQLLSLNSYNQSIDNLQKNNLRESLLYLTYALQQSRTKYPYSINLHNCLMNRMSILYKLMNNTKAFQQILEQIYLVTLSSKGPKHLATIKSLLNYLIVLMIYHPNKYRNVLEYVKEEQGVPQYLIFFDAANYILNQKKFKEGLQKLELLPEQKIEEKIFKANNIGFLRVHSLRQEHKNPVQYLKQVKREGETILHQFLKALVIAEGNIQMSSSYSEQQIIQTEKLILFLEQYLARQKSELPTQTPSSKDVLKHSNSHIIAMNIASILFEMERFKESVFFLQLSLDKAVNQSQLERVGMALILLGRCYFHQDNQKWQDTYLDILKNSSTYPKFIVKETLASYSRLLFQKGRFFEGEHYLNQSLTIDCQSGLEGLILPSYDFSF